MKKIFLLLLCFACLSLNGQNTKIKLTKIKINSKDKYPFKGYLFDVDEDKITLVPTKKGVKQFLIFGNCATCFTIPINFIRDLKFPQKKPFRPYGLMVSTGLGLLLVAITDNTPNPDGLSKRDIAGIYAAIGIGIGVGTDLIRLIGHFDEKNTADINMGLPSILLSKSAVYQFNQQRDKQLVNLVNIFAHIKADETNYRKKIKVYTKDRQLLVGYIIGRQKDLLLLSSDKEKVREYRNNPPDTLTKIAMEHIIYYEFEE